MTAAPHDSAEIERLRAEAMACSLNGGQELHGQHCAGLDCPDVAALLDVLDAATRRIEQLTAEIEAARDALYVPTMRSTTGLAWRTCRLCDSSFEHAVDCDLPPLLAEFPPTEPRS